MLNMMMAWGLALIPAATSAATDGSCATAKLVPAQARAVALVEDAEALDAGLQAFLTQGQQRTLATLVVRIKERSRQEFGLNVLDRAERQTLGLAPGGGFALVWMPHAQAPVLALEATPTQTLVTGFGTLLGSRYVKLTVHPVNVAGTTLQALTVGDVVTPRVYWGHAGGATFISGPRGKEALAAALKAKAAAQAKPLWLPQMQALGPHQLVVLQRLDGVDAATAAVWQVAGMNAHAGGVSVQGSAANARALRPLCAVTAADADSAEASALAGVLAEGALASGHASSTQMLQVGRGATVDRGMLTSVLGPAMGDRVAHVMALAPEAQALLADLDAPMAAAAYPSGRPGHRLQDLLDVAVVARARSPEQRARLAHQAKRLFAAPTAVKGAQPTGHTRAITLGAARGQSITRSTPVPGWDIAVIDHTLIITSRGGGQKRALEALGRLPAAVPQTAARAIPASASVHLSQWSALAERAIVAGAQGALGDHPVAAAMPQLLLHGPTGDLLREVGALGLLQVRLSCSDSGPWLLGTIDLGGT